MSILAQIVFGARRPRPADETCIARQRALARARVRALVAEIAEPVQGRGRSLEQIRPLR